MFKSLVLAVPMALALPAQAQTGTRDSLKARYLIQAVFGGRVGPDTQIWPDEK